MIERRRQARCNLANNDIVVVDLDLAANIGRLETVAVGGFLLVHDVPIPVGEIRRVSMTLPIPEARRSVIRCEARSLWVDEVGDIWSEGTRTIDYYRTGFEFVGLDDYSTRSLELLTERLESEN